MTGGQGPIDAAVGVTERSSGTSGWSCVDKQEEDWRVGQTLATEAVCGWGVGGGVGGVSHTVMSDSL